MKKSPTASILDTLTPRRPSRAQAEDAVRTLIAWSGDDPARAELLDTPRRVTEAFGEYFGGYQADPRAEFATGLEDNAGYDDLVLLRDIAFDSHCEHHMVPFTGVAHVAYRPAAKIAGLSKLARVVQIYAQRLQTQERLTCEIAQALMDGLAPRGVAVLVRAEHQCMSMRGVRQRGAVTVTSQFLGCFQNEASWRDRFLQQVHDAR